MLLKDSGKIYILKYPILFAGYHLPCIVEEERDNLAAFGRAKAVLPQPIIFDYAVYAPTDFLNSSLSGIPVNAPNQLVAYVLFGCIAYKLQQVFANFLVRFFCFVGASPNLELSIKQEITKPLKACSWAAAPVPVIEAAHAIERITGFLSTFRRCQQSEVNRDGWVANAV